MAKGKPNEGVPGVSFRDVANPAQIADEEAARKAVETVPEEEPIDEPDTMKRISAEQPPNPMLGGVSMMFKDDEANHYCLVTEPPEDLHYASKIQQFLKMGYEIVDTISDRQVWMRIAQSTHQRHLREAEEEAAKRWQRPAAAEKERQPEFEDGQITSVTHQRTSHIVTHPDLAA